MSPLHFIQRLQYCCHQHARDLRVVVCVVCVMGG